MEIQIIADARFRRLGFEKFVDVLSHVVDYDLSFPHVWVLNLAPQPVPRKIALPLHAIHSLELFPQPLLFGTDHFLAAACLRRTSRIRMTVLHLGDITQRALGQRRHGWKQRRSILLLPARPLHDFDSQLSLFEVSLLLQLARGIHCCVVARKQWTHVVLVQAVDAGAARLMIILWQTKDKAHGRLRTLRR